MANKSLKTILIFGSLIISGVLIFQSYWLLETWSIKNDEFHGSVLKSLRNVAEKIADLNKITLDKSNLVQKRKSNYYTVNVNSTIDAYILEDFLVQEFDKASLNTVFEYAIYDCVNDSLMHQNFCNLTTGSESFESSEKLRKFDDLPYYFVVNFPEKQQFLINDLRWNLIFSLLTILSVFFFLYTIWVILRQQKVTDLQKDFINNMTHEFKTPISSIKIASDVLLKDQNISTDKRMTKYASIIKDQNERLNNQVEKVLNIARLEKDEFKLNLEEIELNEFLNKICNAEKIKFENQNGNLIFNSLEKEIKIEADKLHFSNVVSNILDNALKYCEVDPQVELTLIEKSDKIIIKISDNGIGIDNDQIKKVFDKFYRVSTGNVHNIKGFGLGLYYVKNICNSHNWKVRVESTKSKGTDFKLEIPKQAQHG